MAEKKKKHTKSKRKKWGKILIVLLLLGLLVFGGFYASIYYGLFGRIPEEKELVNLSQLQASRVLDRHDKLIGKFFITDREAIGFEEIPENLIHALIATEDVRFYEHNGVDKQSLIRVMFKTILLQKKSSGGGSTITLQLAKNLYGRKHYAFLSMPINKIRESIVARRLEKVYNKDEILTLYLNTVPFSGDTYGIESASQKFFNTKTKNLSLSQAATLVGTLKANHSYNPRLFPERSQLRRDVVLQQMVKYDFLSAEEAAQVMKEKLVIDYRNYGSSTGPAPYFNEQVRREVLKILDDRRYRKPDGSTYKLREDGLKIYTTLDADLQEYAVQSMRKHVSDLQTKFEKAFENNPPWSANSAIIQQEITKLPVYKSLSAKGYSKVQIIDSLNKKRKIELFEWQKNVVKNASTIDSLSHYLKFLNAGLLSVDPHSGAILAYVGGIDYRYFQYDHVMQSKRQVGSTFKPFVYAAALENGLSPCHYFPVKEITYKDVNNWTPKNSNRNIDTELNFSMAEALTQSLNTVTVKVLREIGLPALIHQAELLGIPDKIEFQPSVALGVSEIKLIDLVKAYTAFVNDIQSPVDPYFIQRIEDKEGNVIVEFQPRHKNPPAFSEATQAQMIEILKNVVNKGTGQRLRNVYQFTNDLAGKTGTTQENKDGWFVGLLPDLVTVSWVGNDDSRIKFPSTALGQGANSALPIFAGMLQRMNSDSEFNQITRKKFKPASPEILASLDCPPTESDSFFDKLFQSNPNQMSFEKSRQEIKREERIEKKEEKKDKRKKKKGFLKRLFGGN